MKPILFNTPMVQVILSGSKTTTRRVVRKKYSNTDLTMFTNKYGTRLIERQNDAPEPVEFIGEDGVKRTRRSLVACAECKPPYQPGDVLYVRETWGICGFDDDAMAMSVTYKADDSCAEIKLSEGKYQKYYDGMSESEPDWHPSIFMPKEAARLFLRVTSIKTEKLQDITNAGALAEGCDGSLSVAPYDFSVEKFETVWDSTVKKSDIDRYGWGANPWVWVINFERCEKEA